MCFQPHGRLLNGTLTLCGGGDDNTCFSLTAGQTERRWTFEDNFELGKVDYSPATISFDGETWSFLNEVSSEPMNDFFVLHPGESEFKKYEKVNGGIERGCSAQVNRTHAIIVGSPGELHWYEHETPIMMRFQSTNSPNYESTGYHSCGLVYIENDGYKVVFAGGQVSATLLPQAKSDILDLATLTWAEGPRLPGMRYQSVSIQYEDVFLLVAGRGGSIWLDDLLKYDQSEGWLSLPGKLMKNAMHGAMYIYDELASKFCELDT